MKIIPLSAFQDNYIWTIQSQNNATLDANSPTASSWCIVVDPGDAHVVVEYLQQTKQQLLAVLITHHHPDHTGGLAQLKQQWPALRIIGPKAEHLKIPMLTELVADGDLINFNTLDLQFQVLAIPGHTAGHIAFYSAPVLFCGDTLFSVGCGRLFEGSPEQMLHSLTRLSQLPNETQVYCTHEYTLANIRFALDVEPENQDLLQYQQECQIKRAKLQPTLPTTLSIEKKINPFMRCHDRALQLKLNKNSALELFIQLRAAKDQFKS